jgi:hypothetical protein
MNLFEWKGRSTSYKSLATSGIKKYSFFSSSLIHCREAEVLLGGSKEICLEGNVEKTKYVFLSHYQTAGHNYNRPIKAADKSFDTVI